MNIYAPNDASEREVFFRRLENVLLDLEYSSIVLLGDLDAIVDLDLDKKIKRGSKQKRKSFKLPKVFFRLANSLQLFDVWRTKNLFKKQFTFY